MAKKLSKDYTVEFKHFGEITVPKGTKVTSQTACGIDEKYNFVDEFGWVRENYESIRYILTHDLTYYGLNVPEEFLEEIE